MPETTNDQVAVKKKNQFLEVMKRLSQNKGAMLGMIIFIILTQTSHTIWCDEP